MKQAFATLLSSEDYIAPVLILNRNLKELKSQYPLLVMVTKNVVDKAEQYLKKENILYKIVDFLEYSEITKQKDAGTYLLNIASKMNVFTLTEYDKVVFIDADSMFFQNIDDLMNYPDGAMYAELGHINGFAGLFVCIPKNHNLNYYMTLLHSQYMWESDLLGELWFPFKSNIEYQISTNYFVNITLENLEDWNIYDIKGIHFCYHYKPWKYNNINEYFQDYYKEFNNISLQRENIVRFYFEYYLNPLRKEYIDL